ncbi:hypothetical protein [Bradyrhizobium japonicum]|uniref:hypothetical protein n=1 Tax=Bradyrhizobium japonicum TaxID=375 RepID=UPI001BAA6F07|nr:hypothetical protein [Bradyrhizobium japonicum]MBR0913862.1 hypothetical protein [Bradyrhizobium japonicum]
MSDRASVARKKLYEVRGFRREAAERLNLDPRMVNDAIEALAVAGVVPCTLTDNAQALATDGAWMLLGIGSRVRPDAITGQTARFASMTLQIDGGRPWSTKNGSPGATFENELAALFRETWTPAHKAAFPPVQGVGLHWSDGQGTLLFGTIDRWERGRPQHRKIFASEPLRIPQAPGGEWDFIHLDESFRLPTVGGIAFSPLPLLGFIELLAEGVEKTAASVY